MDSRAHASLLVSERCSASGSDAEASPQRESQLASNSHEYPASPSRNVERLLAEQERRIAKLEALVCAVERAVPRLVAFGADGGQHGETPELMVATLETLAARVGRCVDGSGGPGVAAAGSPLAERASAAIAELERSAGDS